MPILYEPSPYAFYTEGDSLTEQEHMDSCDINKMLKSASRGQEVRTGAEPVYGHDDLTMDAVQFRIQKQQLEETLQDISEKNEFLEEELKLIPEAVRNKFKFKTKKGAPLDPSSSSSKKTNDDKTTTKTNPNQNNQEIAPNSSQS